MATAFKACAVKGCNNNADNASRGRRGFCSMHYARWRAHGDPTAGGLAKGEAWAWLQQHVTHDGDDCLRWPHYTSEPGRGQLTRGGRLIEAHRAMCILAHGDPPTPAHEVAHSCGKGHEACVNPKHLRWDTRVGNIADRLLHGTAQRGERAGGARLTEADVREIRSLASTMLHREIAELYGVSRSNVTTIINGNRWAWLD